MKKWTSIILFLVLLANQFCIMTSATGTEDVHIENVKLVAQRYTSIEHLNETVFSQKNCFSYWTGVEEKENNVALNEAIEIATKMRGVTPDKYLYTEILVNLMQMQSGDMAEKIKNQTQFDDVTNLVDYTETIIDSTVGLLVGDSVWAPVWDAVSGGKDVLIQNKEQAKYYNACISDYGQSRSFLEAIIENTGNKDLKTAAKTLLQAQEELLNLRLEYLADSAESLAVYEANFFRDNLSYALLKETELYLTDDTVKWFVDGAEVFTDTITAGSEYVYDMGMVVANLAFGCDDTFKRHQEMRILVDIAEAIIAANNKIDFSIDTFLEKSITEFDEKSLNEIKRKSEYYKMLLAVHARGEYLNYLEFANNESLLSQILVLQDCFKAPEESFMGGYQEWSDKLVEYSDMVDLAISTIEENLPREHKKTTHNDRRNDLPTTTDDLPEMNSDMVGPHDDITRIEEPISFKEQLAQEEIKRILEAGETQYRVDHEDGTYTIYQVRTLDFSSGKIGIQGKTGVQFIESLFSKNGNLIWSIQKSYNEKGLLYYEMKLDEQGRTVEEIAYIDTSVTIQGKVRFSSYMLSSKYTYTDRNVSIILEYNDLLTNRQFSMHTSMVLSSAGFSVGRSNTHIGVDSFKSCLMNEYDEKRNIIRTIDLVQ